MKNPRAAFGEKLVLKDSFIRKSPKEAVE